MWSLNLFPVFKNLIHKIVWNEMELNSYRSSCHRFIPRCLTLVNGLHEIFPVNKLSNWIRLSTTHCWVVINLLRGAGGRMGARRARVWPGCCRCCIFLNASLSRLRTNAASVDTVKLGPAVKGGTATSSVNFSSLLHFTPAGSGHILFSIVYWHCPPPPTHTPTPALAIDNY